MIDSSKVLINDNMSLEDYLKIDAQLEEIQRHNTLEFHVIATSNTLVPQNEYTPIAVNKVIDKDNYNSKMTSVKFYEDGSFEVPNVSTMIYFFMYKLNFEMTSEQDIPTVRNFYARLEYMANNEDWTPWNTSLVTVDRQPNVTHNVTMIMMQNLFANSLRYRLTATHSGPENTRILNSSQGMLIGIPLSLG